VGFILKTLVGFEVPLLGRNPNVGKL